MLTAREAAKRLGTAESSVKAVGAPRQISWC